MGVRIFVSLGTMFIYFIFLVALRASDILLVYVGVSSKADVYIHLLLHFQQACEFLG